MSRKLVRLCEHDSLYAHNVATTKKPQPICPGGEFLPEGTLVIEKVEGLREALAHVERWDEGQPRPGFEAALRKRVRDAATAYFALASQVGESE